MKPVKLSSLALLLLLLHFNLRDGLGFTATRATRNRRFSSLNSASTEAVVSPTTDGESEGTRTAVGVAEAAAGAVVADEVDNASLVLEPPDAFTLWRRRLITREDPFSVHKLSSLVYTASSAFILGTGASRFFLASDGHRAFAEIPSFLEIPSYAFFLSNAVMCAASVRMAFLHRKFDLTARNAFLGTAVSSLFSGYYFLWTSRFAPDAFNNDIFNRSCFGLLVALNVGFILDTLNNIPEVVESRKDRKVDNYEGRFLVDALGYVLPIGWGLIPVVATGFIASVLHDRPWFLEQCLYIDQMQDSPGINANICYLQVFTSLAASYGSLFVTLRDKKLITKQQELAGITVFSVPAMLWTVYVTVVFASYLFDTH